MRFCDDISFLREWSDLDALKGENLSNCGRWCLVLGFIQGFGFGLILWGGCGEIGDMKTKIYYHETQVQRYLKLGDCFVDFW